MATRISDTARYRRGDSALAFLVTLLAVWLVVAAGIAGGLAAGGMWPQLHWPVRMLGGIAAALLTTAMLLPGGHFGGER